MALSMPAITTMPVVTNVFTDDFLKWLEPHVGKKITDPCSVLFRADPKLPEYINKYMRDTAKIPFVPRHHCSVSITDIETDEVPVCLINFSRSVEIDNSGNGSEYMGITFDITSAMTTAVEEELMRPIDTSLPMPYQVLHERAKQLNLLIRMNELKNAELFVKKAFSLTYKA